MNFHALLPEKYHGYLERFTKSEYPASFDAYSRDINHIFEEMDGGFMDAERCAADFVEHIAGRIPKILRRNLVAYDVSRFLFLYTVPAALQYGSGVGQPFADALIEQWNQRFPKNLLKKANFSDLHSGFKTRIMGFDMGRD